MKFHIVTPFSRLYNLPALLEMFRAAVAPGEEISWHPIYHEPAFAGALDDLARSEPWIVPLHATPLPDWDGCYWKCNRGLEHFGIVPEDYYGFLCDDCTYDPGFFSAMSQLEGEVLVCSARRYGGKPGPHGGLLACPENRCICMIGLEQFFVRGSVMERFRFNNIWCGDGELIERLVIDGRQFAYSPHTHMNWNLLPPRDPNLGSS
jgi:hypothetical protein